MTNEATWLPNLVGGTSIWKLAVDLNEPKFFDGRLLVPETEGSESLPVTVRWDVSGLIPLRDAYASHPLDTANAVREFQSCLESVAKVFATPNSGFDTYKEAFTVPSLEADDGANYFYSPEKKRLYVTNWGASPRSMGGKSEYVFGFEDWGKSWGDPAVTAAGVAAAAALAAGGGAATAVPIVPAIVPPIAVSGAPEEKKPEEKKPDPKARPWWVWPLFGLAVIALLLIALFLLKACEDTRTTAGADASDALVESATADAALEAGVDAAAIDGGDASAAADGGELDAGVDAASIDGGADGGVDGGGKDGGLASNDDDDDEPGGGVGGGAAGGGTVVVKVGPAGGAKTSVHRKHYTDEAQAWRVGAGNAKVSRTEQRGRRFDVWLAPGQTFEGVRVEWQDKAGKWHPH